MSAHTSDKSCISDITLTEGYGDTYGDAVLCRDRAGALYELKNHGVFRPFGDEHGPYKVALSSEDNRLVFRVSNAKGKDLPILVLSVRPYQKLIKDYFMLVNAHYQAVAEAGPSRIEALDMGRRALHNEGAELLMARLAGKIDMDLNTARRLFTLICVLHEKKVMLWH